MLAKDFDFRKGMRRDLNGTIKDMAGIMTAVAKISPQAGPAAIASLLPSIMEVFRKQLAISGIPPDKVPQAMIESLRQALMQPPPQPQLAGPVPTEGVPGAEQIPEGGMA